MPHLAAKLPPLRSLVAFEAAARLSSLTAAAAELKITREAVSRHIRALEAHLGVKLFYRVHRAVTLTAAGGKFHGIVRQSLADIAAGAGAIRGRSRRRQDELSGERLHLVLGQPVGLGGVEQIAFEGQGHCLERLEGLLARG